MNAAFCLLAAAVLGAQTTIDAFDYAAADAARQAWRTGEGTAPLEVAAEGGRNVLCVPLTFRSNSKLGRAVVDRKMELDLSTVGGLEVEFRVDPPEAAAHLTLYFHSPGGWFAAPLNGRKSGWNTVRVSKAAFKPEDAPAGWQAVDGVRIAAWRGGPTDGRLLLRRLASVTEEVALVIPAVARKEATGEVKSALELASRVGLLLESLDLGSDALDEDAVARGALGDRLVAILPHNPRMPAETVEALLRFVERGGKLLVCYNLPRGLMKPLGIGTATYVRPRGEGQFAQMRFETDVPGMPAAALQHSWNITAVEVEEGKARVLGRWHTAAGEPTGRAALVLSDSGAFLSHVILGEDIDAKRQMLAAIVGKLAPPLWKRMAAAAIAKVGRIGPFDEEQPLAERVKAAGRPEAEAQLARGRELLAEATRHNAEGRYPQAVAAAGAARQAMSAAYLLAARGQAPEGRAVWNHSGEGAYPGDWEKSARLLAENGFNMVLPNMLWGGLAHYPSDLLPTSATLRDRGDQIAQCLAACKKHGLEVHVWKVNWNLSNAPRAFVEQMRAAGRTQVTAQGKEEDWLCPSHPENLTLERDSMLEVARKYDVDGLHFDYIRYPGGDNCYCGGCRERFEAEKGKVADWPADCRRGTRKDEYHDWRCAQITRLVKAVHDEGKRLRPALKISAAVFSSYPSCREGVGQDWPLWVRQGYVDFLCPMDYTESDTLFRNLVSEQLRLVEGKVPLYPGIGATASRSNLAADEVVSQVEIARTLGAAGFTIFNFQPDVAAAIVPGVGLGATRAPARPPHAEK